MEIKILITTAISYSNEETKCFKRLFAGDTEDAESRRSGWTEHYLNVCVHAVNKTGK